MPSINKNKNEEVVNNHQKTLVLIKLSNVEVEIYSRKNILLSLIK
jgi:hypothetical protein